MSKIKELPVIERPREKAIRFGIDKLSNEELLAILIRTGTKDSSALDIAHLINSDNRGLYNLFQKPYEALLDIKGIGPGKALILSACFELSNRYHSSCFENSGTVDTESLYKRFSAILKKENREVLILVVLNGRHNIVYEETAFIGAEDSVNCPPIDIVKKVIIHHGKSFYLIHNHISGNAYPSDNDIFVTSEVIRTSNKLKVKMIDHIIIGNESFYSFKQNKITYQN